MKPVFLLFVLSLVLPGMTATASATEPPPPDQEVADNSDIAIQAWTGLHLAPPLIDRCVQAFPDKTKIYRAAIRHWLDANHELAVSGESLYRLLAKTRAPGKDPDQLLSAAITRALAHFDTKNPENKLAQCEGVFLMLMTATTVPSP